MPFLRLLIPVLTLLVAACATAVPIPATDIYVVRHLHTPAGERDPDLTEAGRSAAASLAGLMEKRRIAAIYVSDYQRTRQTAAPLAARLGLVPIVYDPADTPSLVARVRAGPLPALIVGHSNTVPGVIAALGGTAPGPLAHEDFGDVWRVAPDGSTETMRIPG